MSTSPIALSQFPGISSSKDSSGALQAALNNGVPIMADCPVSVIAGTDPTKSIFVPDGSDISFVGSGEITADNVGFPLFCFMDTKKWIWRNTKVKYVGKFGTPGAPTNMMQAAAWNSGPARAWAVKRGAKYTAGYVNPYWAGANTCALFSLKGACEGGQFIGGKAYVPDDTLASNFIPMLFAMDPGWTPGVEITPEIAKLSATNDTCSAPANTVFKDWTIDGALMGWVGGGSNLLISGTKSVRYSELQDPSGGYQGGAALWFPPPHLFYLQGSVFPTLPISGKLLNTIDEGIMVGNPKARISTSGFMNTLKVELANGFLVDGYYSRRLYGGVDLLSNGHPGGGAKIRNAFFLIDTSLTAVDGKPTAFGIRYPSAHPYSDVSVEMEVANLQSTWPLPNLPPPGVHTTIGVQLNYGS